MPIYEFRCEACGHTFEHLVLRASDDQPAACPSCAQTVARKLMSAPSTPGSSKGGSCGPPGGRGGFT